jgi:hypothetical protein
VVVPERIASRSSPYPSKNFCRSISAVAQADDVAEHAQRNRPGAFLASEGWAQNHDPEETGRPKDHEPGEKKYGGVELCCACPTIEEWARRATSAATQEPKMAIPSIPKTGSRAEDSGDHFCAAGGAAP